MIREYKSERLSSLMVKTNTILCSTMGYHIFSSNSIF